VGPDGVGKRQFAERLAAALVCEDASVDSQPCGHCKGCQLASAATHPDIYWLEPEEEGKNIRIDAVRGLIGRSVLTTQAKGSRIFVISPAHAMNRAASNALLKTLEEPASSSSLVLISSQPHLLPATIRSRCQTMVFKPVEARQAEQWLSGQVPEPDLRPLLALTGGAPLQALRAMEEGWLADAEGMLKQLTELKFRKVNPMHVVEQWTSRPLGSIFLDFSRICNDLAMLANTRNTQRLFMPQFRESLEILAKGMDLKRLFAFYDELYKLQRQMTHNLNPQMLLEKLMTDWLSLTRPGAR
jgi:DNA polymerase-3 subunit delta'